MAHSPQIALTAARHQLEQARESCAHWDYESDGDGHACCDAVSVAIDSVRRARRRAAKP